MASDLLFLLTQYQLSRGTIQQYRGVQGEPEIDPTLKRSHTALLGTDMHFLHTLQAILKLKLLLAWVLRPSLAEILLKAIRGRLIL